MNTPIRYGIIGSGMMGREHMQNIALIPDSEIVAIADPYPESRALAGELAGPGIAVYEDYRELLGAGGVDALVVATPNHTHLDVLQDIIRDGSAAVLVEKPLCTTLEQARRLTEAAAGFAPVFWVGQEYRFMPPVARLIDEIRAGRTGRLRMLAIREHRFPFLAKVGDWNRFNRNTGGTLVEKCCHFFDLMRLILEDEPVRIYGSGDQDVNHLDERYDGETPDMLDNAFVTVDFRGGSRALLDLCMFAEASRFQEEIAATGDAGKVECFVPPAGALSATTVVVSERGAPEVTTIPVEVDEKVLAAGHHYGSTYFEHLAFQRAVRGDGAVLVTLEDGLKAVAMGLAAERSIAERRPIDLGETYWLG